MNQTITAVFVDRDRADTALCRLRMSGAVCRDCELPPSPGVAGSATLHLSVRTQDAALARSIIRGNGGML